MTLKERDKKLKVDIPTIFLVMRDQDTPLPAKILAMITVGYALSPIDLIPDFIPVLCYLDDVILLPLLILLTLKCIPEDIYAKHHQAAEHLWEDGKPKKWYYALPIVCIWLLVFVLILKMIWK